jgi:predicted nucleic acid-binding protein
MPVADTEFIFALNPKDRKHQYAIRLLKEISNLIVPDTAALEFQVAFRARGRNPSQVEVALLALYKVLKRNNVEKAKTLSLSLLAFQSEIEENYGLSCFDSLLAASA